MNYIIKPVIGESVGSSKEALEHVEAAASKQGLPVLRSHFGLVVGAGDRGTAEAFVDDPNINREKESIYMEAGDPALGSCPESSAGA